MASAEARLDVITIGRSSVDLYGQQIGSRLEDIASFAKSVGGCPSNIAIGAARLGLKSGLITRVGDEQMGRFIREQMAREGVALDGIVTDPQRLTSLVLLSVVNDRTFPLIFYRENCADSALCEDDIDPAFISAARAVLVTGTHFARPLNDHAQRKAVGIARRNGLKVVLDIDYRPNLWGLAGHAAGEERYIKSDRVSEHLQSILPDCDLIVGTEEEVHIAGAAEETLTALRTIRSLTSATLVLKRGPMGCVVFPAEIPERIEDGIVGKGFPIEVYNVLGAGDAFMAGFLRGWLRGEPLETCATWANACGAFAVSRLLCSPEIPTFEELQFFLEHGSPYRALRKDEAINNIHWATTRRPAPPHLLILGLDHALDAVAAIQAIGRLAAGQSGFGVLLDDRHGPEALFEARSSGLWIGRLLEIQDSQDIGSKLIEWPVTHTVRYRVSADPEERDMAGAVFDAARRIGRELMIEVVAGSEPADEAVDRLYGTGIKPDWWALPAPAVLSRSIGEIISARDPHCRGIIATGSATMPFEAAAGAPFVRGFALEGPIDHPTVDKMASHFQSFVDLWQKARDRKAA
ncbi:MAG: 5-dehydro-2-deoxygluconokinase [Hyphomicrobiales bacterium]